MDKHKKKIEGVAMMEIFLLIFLLLVGLTIVVVFGTMAFLTVKDYFEERKH